MLLPRRVLASCPRVYGRVIVCGVFVTLLVCLLYKVNTLPVTDTDMMGHSPADVVISGRGGPLTEQLTGTNHHKRRLEMEIEKDLAQQRPGLGDKGAPAHLSGSEEERGKQDLAKIAINEELSKHLSYNRSTPDGRNPHCKRLRYDTKKLPTAAVIIIFYDEAFSVIVRTVHSVLNTASENLKEVILVDDASTHEELKDKLDYYVATRLPKSVKLIRMKSR